MKPAIFVALCLCAFPVLSEEIPDSVAVSWAIATAARAQADWPDGGVKLFTAKGISREGALGLIRFHQEIQVARAADAAQDRNDLCAKQNLLDTDEKVQVEMERLSAIASRREQARTDTIFASLSEDDHPKFRQYVDDGKKLMHGVGYPDGTGFTVASLAALCGSSQ